MRKLVITLAAGVAIGAVGMPLWQAHAANLGDGGIKFAIKNYTPITKAACWGWGPYWALTQPWCRRGHVAPIRRA